MKKILGISLVAILMATPMMAGAVDVAGEPTAGNADSPTATNVPRYALKGAGDHDDTVVTAGYVKGAYNAIIKGINKTQDEIDTLNSGIDTYSDAIDHLADGKATKAGTVATIKTAQSTDDIVTSSVNITGVTTSSISATASGNVNLSVPVLDNWGSDNLASSPIQTTTAFSGLNVDNIAMGAPTSNTATLTKNDFTSTVNVANYLAQAQAAAPAYDFTPLINPDGDDYGYKIVDGSNSYNANGLENGEWKVIWNSYGTAKGTSMCSSTGNDESFGEGDTTLTIDTNGGDNATACWCKMTGWTPNGESEQNMSSLWVFYAAYRSASDCASNCASHCPDDVSYNSYFRSGLFGSVQQ